MTPLEALERIATLLERSRAGRYKEEAFRRAAERRARPSRTTSCARSPPPVASRTSPASATAPPRVIAQALAGEVPEYLARLEAEAAPDAGAGGAGPGRAPRRPAPALRLVRRRRRRSRRWPARRSSSATSTSRSPTTRPSSRVAHGLERRPAAPPARRRGRAERGAGAVPHPHRHRGRHPRGRRARPGGRAARRARRRRRERALEAAHGRRRDDRSG